MIKKIQGDDRVIRYYKTVGNKVEKIQSIEEGCWVNCVKPTDSEINYILNTCNVNPEFIRASLDEEESSRIDREEENSLIIIDNPVVNKSGKNLTYYTTPLSIIITPHNIITISLKETHVLEEFEESLIKNTNINDKNRFVLQIMLRVAGKYLKYLKQINKITERVEEELKKSMKNKELIQFLEIEKSLVYFSASLKSIGVMLGRMGRGKYINLNEEQYELLEDVIIEIKQATEMSEIYLNILNGTMDAFASIISNNLNGVMKFLTSITIPEFL